MRGAITRSIAAGICDTVRGWIWYCDLHDTHGNADSEAEAVFMLEAHLEWAEDDDCASAGFVVQRSDPERPDSPADESRPTLERLLRTDAAIAYAKKSRSQLYRLAERGLLTRYRVGAQAYWDRRELDDLVTPVSAP